MAAQELAFIRRKRRQRKVLEDDRCRMNGYVRSNIERIQLHNVCKEYGKMDIHGQARVRAGAILGILLLRKQDMMAIGHQLGWRCTNWTTNQLHRKLVGQSLARPVLIERVVTQFIKGQLNGKSKSGR
jgi:hypothetical protein